MKTKLNHTSIVVRSQDQVSADLSSDVAKSMVILNLKDGVYYELKEVGVRVWHLIQEPRSLQSIVDAILEEYDVPAQECAADVMALAESLAKFGLIEIQSTEETQ